MEQKRLRNTGLNYW